MKLMDAMRAKARADVRKIVFPEGDEPRTMEAAEILRGEGLADPVLLTPDMTAADAARYERVSLSLSSQKELEIRTKKTLLTSVSSKMEASRSLPKQDVKSYLLRSQAQIRFSKIIFHLSKAQMLSLNMVSQWLIVN